MIFYAIGTVLLSIFGVIFAVFPVVTTLPFGMDSALTTAIGYVNSFFNDFPLLLIVWHMTLWYLGIRVFLLILKVLLGSRAPQAN